MLSRENFGFHANATRTRTAARITTTIANYAAASLTWNRVRQTLQHSLFSGVPPSKHSRQRPNDVVLSPNSARPRTGAIEPVWLARHTLVAIPSMRRASHASFSRWNGTHTNTHTAKRHYRGRPVTKRHLHTYWDSCVTPPPPNLSRLLALQR